MNPAAQWGLEMDRFYLELLADAGAAIIGRRLYEQYVLHWNQVAEGAIAPETKVERQWTQRLRSMPKHVISSSLPELVANTKILAGDIRLTSSRRQGAMYCSCAARRSSRN